MAAETFIISGHYSATFAPNNGSGGYGAAVSIGDTKDGIKVSYNSMEEDVHTDTAGDSPIDTVNRGTSYEIQLDYADYIKIKPLIFSHSGEGKAYNNTGMLGTQLAGQLVLTATGNTPANTISGAIATLTANYAKIKTNVPILLANHARQGPITIVLLPDSTGTCYAVT
jgi:hypothetical protein